MHTTISSNKELTKDEALKMLERQLEVGAALDRVRAVNNTMEHSDELIDTSNIILRELQELDIPFEQFLFLIMDEDEQQAKVYADYISNEGLTIPMDEHPFLFEAYENWENNEKTFRIDMEGDELSNLFHYWYEETSFKSSPEERKQARYKIRKRTYYFASFSQGIIMTSTEEPLDEEVKKLQTFRRFATAFDQTYRRFLDLQEAEERVRLEARNASVDRLRADIASMRSASELQRITPLIWQELKKLEIPFFRCGVFIVEEEKDVVQMHLSTPEGKALTSAKLNRKDLDMFNKAIKSWNKGKIYTANWDADDLTEWTGKLKKRGAISSKEKYFNTSETLENLALHFVPFKQGLLYIGSEDLLAEKHLKAVQDLADAFSVAYARYEDFQQLDEKNKKLEQTLEELREAQEQLVRQEKLASLGQLTAGIAHEIKNPLNFVNNFSDVSIELIEEMREELEGAYHGTSVQIKGIKGALEILKDVEVNQHKILEHGNRADNIVKSMLQQSRGKSGEKVSADINKILDEYVNLAYHGMRATDQSFNIDIQTDFDENIPKMDLVAQDISRAFLNIIKNGMYATNEKAQQNGEEAASLKVQTELHDEKVEIRIRDNGPGIPDDIREKIFEPFFTTKPTGVGTGLGLSMTYDIITMHNGTLDIETEEGKFTEFIITLPDK